MRLNLTYKCPFSGSKKSGLGKTGLKSDELDEPHEGEDDDDVVIFVHTKKNCVSSKKLAVSSQFMSNFLQVK